jgi:hypothetical protein
MVMGIAARWLLAVGTILVVSPLFVMQAAEGDEMVANPFYKYWANHKAGSTVTLLEKTILTGPDKEQSPDGIDEKVVTTKLLKVTLDKEVVVEVTATERDFLKTIETAPTKTTYPAKVKKAWLQAALHGADPKMGKDTLTLLDKKFDCITVSGTEKKEGTVVDHEIWLSEKVPGGIVKHTRVTKQDGKLVADTTIVLQSYKSE